MAYVTVRHLDDKDFGNMCCKFDDTKRLEYAKEVLRNNNYKRVSDIVLSGSLGAILNEAYFLTNSVDFAWYENTDIDVKKRASKGCRSTSIGDIIQVAGESYMVASVGFKHIDLEG